MNSGSYWYMSESVWDSIIFIPTVNIYLLGFGMMNHNQKKDFKLTFKYYIDEETMEDHHTDVSQSMVTEENMFDIFYEKCGGIPPRQVNAG